MLTDLGQRARIDLHLHTTRSDGAFSPDELLAKCAAGGLDLIAITDHDLTCPVAPGVHEVNGRSLRVLAGAELSGEHEGREFHLLVYFPGSVPQPFLDFCRDQCVFRASRYEAAVQRLAFGDLPPADAQALRGERALTRLHLARALVEQGHASHVGDAFGKWLGDSQGLVPVFDYPFLEAIRVARQCGGLTSWAHPSVADAEAHLATFAAAGLQGIEGLRPHLNARDRSRLRKLANRHGLYLTGGSDWHGWTGGEPGLFALSPAQLSDFVDALRAA